MSVRALLALVFALALAIALILWLGRRPAGGETAGASSPLIVAFSEDALRDIELTCGGTGVSMARDDLGGWRITKPFEGEADPRRVTELVAALQEARIKKVISESAHPNDAFGLSPAACTVRLGFSPPAPSVTLRLGRSSPLGNDRYAASGDARVVLTDGGLFSAVSRGPGAFRERRLVPVEPEAITRIVLERPGGRLVIAQDGSRWRLEAPYADAASSSACIGLARAVTALELTGTDLVPAPAGTLASRRLKLEISTRGSASPTIAFIADKGIDGKRLGWRDGARLAGLVEDASARALDRPAESFRESRVASFSAPDVRRMTVEQGGVEVRISREREGAPWSGAAGSSDFTVDGGRVADVLDRMRTLNASGFESGNPSTRPTGTIVIEDGRSELARLTWGPLDHAADAGSRELWVTTPARPGVVFRMSVASFGVVPSRPADWATPAGPPATALGGS